MWCSVFKYMPCDFECWLRSTYISALCSVYTATTWFHPSRGVYMGAGVSFAKGKQREVLLIELDCLMIRSGEGLVLTLHVISDLFSVWRRYLISPFFLTFTHKPLWTEGECKIVALFWSDGGEAVKLSKHGMQPTGTAVKLVLYRYEMIVSSAWSVPLQV